MSTFDETIDGLLKAMSMLVDALKYTHLWVVPIPSLALHS